jgi:hypothetical protein
MATKYHVHVAMDDGSIVCHNRSIYSHETAHDYARYIGPAKREYTHESGELSKPRVRAWVVKAAEDECETENAGQYSERIGILGGTAYWKKIAWLPRMRKRGLNAS